MSTRTDRIQVIFEVGGDGKLKASLGDIASQSSKAAAGMDDAEKRMARLEARAVAAGTVIGNLLSDAISSASRVIFRASADAINFADSLNDMNQRLGVSAEALSGWAYAAQQTGTDINALGTGLKFLARNMAAALDPKSSQAGLFKALGVDVVDALGKLRSVEDVLPDVADKFQLLDNATAESAMAMDIFGRSGTDLIEMLNLGAGGIAEFRDRARELGVELSQNTLSAADEFNDTLADMKTVGQGLAMQLAQQLLPSLQRVAGMLRDTAQEGAQAGTALHSVGTGANSLVDELEKANRVGKGTILMLTALKDGSAQAFKGLGTLLFEDTSRGIDQIKAASDNARRAHYLAFNDLPDFSNVRGSPKPVLFAGIDPDPDGLFKRSAAEGRLQDAEAARRKQLSDRLSSFMSAGKDSGQSGNGKSALSEEEQAAKRLLELYERLKAQKLENIALMGQESEEAKARYAVEHGELSKLSEARKQEIIQLAQEEDKKRALLEAAKEAADLADKEREAKQRSQQFAKEMLSDMQFELDLLTMTNRQRAEAIYLRRSEGEATAEQVSRAGDLAEQREQMERALGYADDMKSVTKSFLMDMSKDAAGTFRNIGDYWEDLVDRMLSRWLDAGLDGLFSGQGFSGFGGGGGGSGGGLGGILGGLFSAFSSSGGSGWSGSLTGAASGSSTLGSGITAAYGNGFNPFAPRAQGGGTSKGQLYEVAEFNRPEVFKANGRTWLIPGSNGYVQPMGDGMRGGYDGGGNVHHATYNFDFRGTDHHRASTPDQISQRIDERVRRTGRNR